MNDTEDRIFLDRKPGLYLKHVDGKGRGVFCIHDIKKGEELENTPALILNEKAHETIVDTVIFDYVFDNGEVDDEFKEANDIKDLEGSSCIVMGIGSYCNHDHETPNAQVVWEQDGETLYYSLMALRDIPAGTEICTSYGATWFEDHGYDLAETRKMWKMI